jgi:pimeloyl-ACP methyl ester carboxylesterase
MIDGRQVHYLEWGHAKLPAVLCLHGGGQTAYMYESLGESLGTRFHVLAPDLPDHGDSDPLPAEWADRGELAASLPPLLEAFGINRVVAVGGSLGGIVSVTLAAARPELVEGLVMIDVGHHLEPEGVQRIISFMTDPESFASLEEAAEAIAAYSPFRGKIDAPRLTRNLRQRADGRWVWKHGLGRRMRSVDDMDEHRRHSMDGFEDDLRALRIPVLVLRGTSSDVLSEEGAEELVGLLHNGRLARISGAGHLAAGDNPNSFRSLVTGFLDDLDWG